MVWDRVVLEGRQAPIDPRRNSLAVKNFRYAGCEAAHRGFPKRSLDCSRPMVEPLTICCDALLSSTSITINCHHETHQLGLVAG